MNKKVNSDFTYTTPVIVDYKGDTSKDWFIYSRIDYEGKRHKIVWKKGINRFKNAKERYKEINQLLTAVKKELKDGWNPLIKEPVKKKEPLTKVLNDILELKKSSFKPKSYRNYSDIKNMFVEWLERNKIDTMLPERFGRSHAQAYSDFMVTKKNYAGKTHNNNIGIIKALFSEMVDREIIEVNPFLKIKMLKEDRGKNFPFTDEEKVKLINHMTEHCPHYYLACCFTYFCFIRRSELIELRFQDIDLENKTIIIHSKGAKGRKQESVTIPVQFEEILRQHKIDTYPKELYVFGRRCCPNKTKLKKPDYYSYRFRLIANSLGIDKTKGYYAWKHTGVCALYRSMDKPDVNVIRIQCRHTDIKTTMIYLRSLGLLVNEQIRDADFRI